MINIVKYNDKYLIADTVKNKENIKLKIPFELKRTVEGLSITPYDLEMLDTFIPQMEIAETDIEYVVKPEKTLEDFYKEKSTKFQEEVNART